MTGFIKTDQSLTRAEIRIKAYYYWYTHALSRSINHVSIDGQVCFHRWLFTNPVRPHWCISGPVGPLGSTNQNWLCARVPPMAVAIYPVVCVHSCHLLRTQHHYLLPNGRKGLPLACPPISTTPFHPPTHYKQHPWYYRGCKKLPQKPAVNNA